ncbi:MAG TPA: hypothetical protein VFF91_06225 [Pseudoxanthomonas sp.]|nr:hypothetical protein [Pseudoxanthomonas sp.]
MSSPFLKHSSLAAAIGLLFIAATGVAAEGNNPAPDKPAATAPKPLSPAERERLLAVRQYAELHDMLALDSRCHWLDPVGRAAIEATANERLAWYVSRGWDQTEAVTAARDAVARRAGQACNDEAGGKLGKAVQFGAWQMRVTWALRGAAMLPGKDKPAWFAGKSSVSQHRTALETAAAGIEAFNPEPVAKAKPAILQAVQDMLPVRCKSAEKGCPPPPRDARQAAYAETWVRQAELFADTLAKAKDKVGKPPQ